MLRVDVCVTRLNLCAVYDTPVLAFTHQTSAKSIKVLRMLKIALINY